MHIIADPRDENVVYIMDVEAYKSTDGGHLFNESEFRTATITDCGSIPEIRGA